MVRQIYKAKDGWRWRLRARNGRIVAVSGEAFRSKRNASQSLDRLFEMVDEALDDQAMERLIQRADPSPSVRMH